jgi:hypothetical protein
MGYRGIAYRLASSSESQSGSMAEVDEYAVVARARDGTPKRFRLVISSSAWTPMRSRVHDETPIGEGEYPGALKALGGMRDTAEWYADRERRSARLKQIDSEIQHMVPQCPACRIAMEVKHRRSDNQAFFGCPNFNTVGCRQTSPIPAATRHRLDALHEERSRVL